MDDEEVVEKTLCFMCVFSDTRGQYGDTEVESRYQRSRLYLDLNERLQEVKGQLTLQRAELRTAGERLDHDVAEVKRGLML